MVAPAIIGMVLEGARTVLDRVLPDPAARAAAELELRKLEAEGSFDERARQALAIAQISVNQAEAASPSIFVGGWRPMVGWVCAAALAGQYVVSPLASWLAAIAGHPFPPPPTLDGVLWELLAAMLGLGTLRTVEKVKGKA
jgi:hypothetical protein